MFCVISLFKYSSGLYCGAYGGREKKLNLVLVLFLPRLYSLSVMDFEIVEDKKDFLISVFNESSEERFK